MPKLAIISAKPPYTMAFKISTDFLPPGLPSGPVSTKSNIVDTFYYAAKL